MRASSASRSAALARPLAICEEISFSECALPLSARFLVAIDQHDLEPGARRDISDARAHEAGADDADLASALVAGTSAGRRAPLLSSPIDRNSERIIAAASFERRIFAK